MNTIQQWRQHQQKRHQIDLLASDLDPAKPHDKLKSIQHHQIQLSPTTTGSILQGRRYANELSPQHRHWIFNSRSALSLLLTASLVLTVGIAPGSSQERKPSRTITASGKGIVTIPTTISQIRLAIEVTAKTPNQAQQDAAKRSTRVVDFLKTQQVDKLQTTGINLNPTYSYPPNGQPQLTGYTASNSISFQVTTDRAGAILDAAVRNGATRIDGVNFVASDRAIATAQLQALKQATQDAERQADTVLQTLNLKRREVIGVQINSASTPVPLPMPMQARADMTATKPATPVVGGEQQVEAAVTLDIGY
ncbi:SIMPL domain-containing protein [Chamaesiphon sp. OTE_20_metabat_361]|uniref:SIMPL domain-containing protein n=1 Tax=Chamaesiphon sp. OTE_20_metabat_361 TaxID=2964689 RepID=UPI00286C2033|nr:SIMPL domain-containing protein [Chamaesiphon sp. OTE_20_metabat_361]